MDRLKKLLDMLREDPKDSFIRYAVAQECLKREEYDHAIQHFEQLRSDDPDYVGLYYHLAGLYADLEKVEDAQKIYELGIEKAKELGDQHALSELMNAKMNFELEL